MDGCDGDTEGGQGWRDGDGRKQPNLAATGTRERADGDGATGDTEERADREGRDGDTEERADRDGRDGGQKRQIGDVRIGLVPVG